MSSSSSGGFSPSEPGHHPDAPLGPVRQVRPADGEQRMKSLEETISDLARSISDLARRVVAEYAPAVDSIVSVRSEDVRQIEHTLDGLLDFCFDPEALLLYKKLCRHYFVIDPVATAEYVHAYRDMWDSEREV